MTLAEAQSELKGAILSELDRAGLLLSTDEFDRTLDRIYREGSVLWRKLLEGLDTPVPSTAPVTLGLDQQVMERVMGFGSLQTEALAAATGPHRRRIQGAALSRMGAVLNLGIGLFDWITDRFPNRAEIVQSRVTRKALESLAAGQVHEALPRASDDGINLLFAIIRAFFVDLNSANWSSDVRNSLHATLQLMLESQTVASRSKCFGTEPPQQLWQHLRNKSVLPVVALALVGTLDCHRHTQRQLQRAREVGSAAGELLWIIDDLVDAVEDWEAGAWSRPWVLYASSPVVRLSESSTSTEALGALLASGIVHTEAAQLVSTFMRLAGLVNDHTSAEDFTLCFRTTIQSWIARLPGNVVLP